MSGTAHTTRASVGLAADRVIFVTFGGAEEDMIAGGEAAKGTYAVRHVRPGKDIPLVADILKTVYAAGKGDFGPDTTRAATISHTRRMPAPVPWREGTTAAEAMFGHVTQPL